MTKEQLDAIRARLDEVPLLGEMRTDTLGNIITVTREHPVVTLLAEVERLTTELHRMKSRPVEAEFSRLDTMWQKLVRERDEAVHEISRLKGVRSEVNTAKLNDAFTEGTLKAGEAMRPLVAAAFARGVAAMRAATVLASRENIGCRHVTCHSCESPAAVIRALPDPEDTE